MSARRIAIALAAAAVVALASVGVWYRSQRRAHAIALFVDNGTDGEISVELDGQVQAKVPKWTFIAIMTSKGPHKIIASQNGAPLEQIAFKLDGEPGVSDAYIYNVDGRSRYGVYVHDENKPPLPVGVGARIFPIPPEVGRSFASRFTAPDDRRVYHVPVHHDRPCCRAFFQ